MILLPLDDKGLALGVRYLDDFMRHSFRVMHDELHTVKVRISPGWARWVSEKIWHESQKVTKLANGSLEMTFRVGRPRRNQTMDPQLWARGSGFRTFETETHGPC